MVDDLAAELREPLGEPGVADRRRAHVDAAAPRAEVERRADDRDRLHATKANTDARLHFAAGEVAQLVEHTAENRGVAGSIPALAMRGAPGGAPR